MTKQNNCLRSMSLMVILTVVIFFSTVDVWSASSSPGATVTFYFDSSTSSLVVDMNSPFGVGGAQVKVDIPSELTVGSATLTGFMTGATHLVSGTEHRWFQLSANGENAGSVTIPITFPSIGGTYTVSLIGVDLKDTAGNTITIDTALPISLPVPPSTPISVFIDPKHQFVRRGQRFSVEINVDPGTHGVSGGEINLAFDPSIMGIVSVSPGNLLGSDSIIGAKEVDNNAGTLKYALARRGTTTPPTQSGTFTVVEFEVKSAAPSGKYTITITRVGLADENYNDIPNIDVRSGVIEILGISGDINGDGIVDYKDLAILGASYGKREGEAGFNPSADLNDDGIIDYKDLAILGANYGRKTQK